VASYEDCLFWNLKLLLEGDKSENGTEEEIWGIHMLEFLSVLIIWEGEYLYILMFEMMHWNVSGHYTSVLNTSDVNFILVISWNCRISQSVFMLGTKCRLQDTCINICIYIHSGGKISIVLLSGNYRIVTVPFMSLGASSGCGWRSQPPDIEGGCEYIQWAVSTNKWWLYRLRVMQGGNDCSP
jgi:hypothetical protein